MGHVFISYAREDRLFAEEVVARVTLAGRSSWVDWTGISPSAEWLREIYAAIDGADAFVMVVTPTSVESHVCGLELQRADKSGKRIFPLVFASVEPHLLPGPIASRQWIDCTKPEALPRAFEVFESAMARDPEWLAEHTRLTERAEEWRLFGDDPSRLLRGRDLRAAERALDGWVDQEPHPTEVQRAFVAASRRRASTIFRRLATTFSALLGAASFAGAIAWWQWGVAEDRLRTATSQRVALESTSTPARRPETALALAVAAVDVAPTLEARRALWKAVNDIPRLEFVWRRDRATEYRPPLGTNVAWTRASRELVASDRLGRLDAWRFPSGVLQSHEAVDEYDRSIGDVIAGKNFVATLGSSSSSRLVVRDGKGRRQVVPNTILEREFVAMAAHPHADRFAAIADDGFMAELRGDGSLINTRQFVAHASGLSYARNGRWLIATTTTGNVATMEVRTGAVRRRRILPARFLPFVADPRGDLFVAGSDDDRLIMGHIRTSRHTDTRLHQSQATALALSPAGEHLAAGRLDGVVEVVEMNVPGVSLLLGATDDTISSVAFSHDGRRLAVADSQEGLTIWRTDVENVLAREIRPWDGRRIFALAMHPQGHQVAVALEDRRIVVLSLEHPSDDATVYGPRPLPAFSLDYSPDGDLLAVGDVDRFRDGSGTFEVYDTATRVSRFSPRMHRIEAIHPLPFAGEVGTRVLFDGSGRRLVTAGIDHATRVWDVGGDAPRLLPSIEESGIEIDTFADRDRIVVRRPWGLQTRTLPASAPPDERLVDYDPTSVSDDGSLLASRDRDQQTTLELRAEAPGSIPVPLRAHRAPISASAFQPGGHLLVSGDRDGEVWLWDSNAVASIGSFRVWGSVTDLVFTPDGRWLVVATAQGKVEAWPMDLALWKERACRVISRLALDTTMFHGVIEAGIQICDHAVTP